MVSGNCDSFKMHLSSYEQVNAGHFESDDAETGWSLRPESTQKNLPFPGASRPRSSLRPFQEQTLPSNPGLVIDDHFFGKENQTYRKQ